MKTLEEFIKELNNRYNRDNFLESLDNLTPFKKIRKENNMTYKNQITTLPIDQLATIKKDELKKLVEENHFIIVPEAGYTYHSCEAKGMFERLDKYGVFENFEGAPCDIQDLLEDFTRVAIGLCLGFVNQEVTIVSGYDLSEVWDSGKKIDLQLNFEQEAVAGFIKEVANGTIKDINFKFIKE